jgi:hypothetical protein
MTERNRPLACPHCGTNLPQTARFCLSCGNNAHRLDYPTTVHQIQRQPLGLEPPQLLGGLSAMAVVVAVVLFAAGASIAGVFLMIVALTLAALLLAAVRREPQSPSARVVGRGSDRAVSLTKLTLVAAREWLRAILKLLDHARREARREAPVVARVARSEIARERASSQPTKAFAAGRGGGSAGGLLERRPEAVDR